VSDLLEYAGVRFVEGAASLLPRRAAERGGELLGRLARRPLGVRREVVEGQISRAFPDRSEDWVRATAEACYRHFGREFLALARMGRIEPDDLLARTADPHEVLGTWRSVVPEGSGGIVVTGHLGNWELAGALLAALGLPVAAVVKRQRNARFDRRLRRLRDRLGIEPVYMKEAARRLPAALAEGKLVALVADQDAGTRGVFVPFLGRPASTFRGPARLALRHDVPLVFGALVRDGDGYRPVVSPIDLPSGGPAPERELTRRWVARFEEEIRRRPGQYFWFHRRWKTRPDGTRRETRSRDR
jgi:KDO2-lipid IV(A) lauroyltransferase